MTRLMMKVGLTLTVAGLIVGGVVPRAAAEVLRLDGVELQPGPAGVAAGSTTSLLLPLGSIPKNAVVTYAELRFQVPLPAGTELELWEAANADSIPWESAQPPTPRRWVMDKRTGTLVRFDITDLLVSRAAAGSDLDVIIRLDPRNEVSSRLAGAETTYEVLYHTIPRGRK